MWNSSQSGGGFMNDTNTNTPSKGASGGSGKNKKQNIVPVNIIKSLSLHRFLHSVCEGVDQ